MFNRASGRQVKTGVIEKSHLNPAFAQELASETVGVTNTGVHANVIIDEVVTSRGEHASVAARFVSVEEQVSNVNSGLHNHYHEDKQLLAGDPTIDTSSYSLTTGTFVAGDKSLQVFVNGMLQMDGIHYTEVTDTEGDGIGVNFAPELLVVDDILQFRWTK